MPAALSSPSARRNRGPILEVLRRHLPDSGTVLEIASGTGEHVVFLAAALPGLVFQPSDPDPAARASISAWIAEAGVGNVRAPLKLDVAKEDWHSGLEPVEAVLALNLVHISPWGATLGLMRGAARLLGEGGILYLYGAYRRGGRHNAPSNERFDAALRSENPAWGVRDLEDVVEAARGFDLAEVVEMPASNLSVVFRRQSALRRFHSRA